MPELPVDAHSIPRRTFTVARRGFEQHEVRAYLQQIAELVARLQRHEIELEERVGRAETRAELAEKLDEHRLVEIVGEETARVLETARSAAQEIRTKAEESAARVLSAGHEEINALRAQVESEMAALRETTERDAAQLRADAEKIMEVRSGEAELEAQRILAGVNAEADRAREQAKLDVERILSEGQAKVEAARDDARRLVAEAEVMRERVLRDLARRRRTARKQVERLNAGRERLLSAFELVRGAADSAVDELTSSLPDARIAADAAARAIDAEVEETLEQLEAELAALNVTVDLTTVPTIDVRDDSTGGGDDSGEHDVLAQAEPPRPVVRIDDLAPDPVAADPVEAQVEASPAPVGADEAAGAVPAAPAPRSRARDQGGERRSSSLRLFRRRSEAIASGDGGDAELVEVEPPDEVEEVRVIGTAATITEEKPAADGADRADGSDGAANRVDDAFARLRAEHAAPAATAEAAPEADASTPEAEQPITPEAEALAERDAVLEPIERDLGKRLKRALADEQNEVLDRIRRDKPKSVNDLVPAVEAHARVYADAASTGLSDAANAGASAVGSATADGITVLADELGRALAEPLRARIERSLDEADGDADDLSERLRALYREWKGQRITDAVRHYTVAAYARGVFDAAPEGCSLRWIVDTGGEPCPDADDNNLAGPVLKGSPFPTGDIVPPAHPGCRCLALPEQH
jgi:cell division septum initiation protein DivIVA